MNWTCDRCQLPLKNNTFTELMDTANDQRKRMCSNCTEIFLDFWKGPNVNVRPGAGVASRQQVEETRLRADMRLIREAIKSIRNNPELENLGVYHYMFLNEIIALMDRYSLKYRKKKLEEADRGERTRT